GLFASTAFTLLVIPTVYYLVYGRKESAPAEPVPTVAVEPGTEAETDVVASGDTRIAKVSTPTRIDVSACLPKPPNLQPSAEEHRSHRPHGKRRKQRNHV
ncbi:MAG: hypothetical protein ACOYOU_09780, partial [Kiritimatiellia bacterium]